MPLNCGIVGLPNVGKSTLFSALTSVQAEIANYPFCTIQPNIGLVEIPDKRLHHITNIYSSKKTIPTVMEFVDIAGIVKGASKGEGLGNTFLSHIRETGLIAHVVRCFEDNTITHVNGTINPISDIHTILTELALADLATVQKRIDRLDTEKRSNKPELKRILPVFEPLLEKIQETLNEGTPIRSLSLSNKEKELLYPLHLITEKPMIYICNVAEEHIQSGNAFTRLVEQYATDENTASITICASLEAEVGQLKKEEQKEFLESAGIKETGLSHLIQTAYHILGLRTYFTASEKETRAWTFKAGTLAPQAAGIIHTDFERGFIKAYTFSYADLCTFKNEAGVRSAGKLRIEGKEYKVKDGDILHFTFNV